MHREIQIKQFPIVTTHWWPKTRNERFVWENEQYLYSFLPLVHNHVQVIWVHTHIRCVTCVCVRSGPRCIHTGRRRQRLTEGVSESFNNTLFKVCIIFCGRITKQLMQKYDAQTVRSDWKVRKSEQAVFCSLVFCGHFGLGRLELQCVFIVHFIAKDQGKLDSLWYIHCLIPCDRIFLSLKI